MRAGFAYIFIVLLSAFWAASPALAAPKKTRQPARATVVQTAPAVAQQGHSQHCDQLEDTEVITATNNQNNAYGPVLFSLAHGFDSIVYPVVATPLPAGRDNARIQPLHQLILFPFHGFW
ncbi:MAG TPA: hypothetical protein VGC22_03850 [Chitinophaga sp.]